MPSIAAVVTFGAKDQVSKEYRRMAKAAEKSSARQRKSFMKSSKAAAAFKGVLGGVLGANVISKGTQLMTQSVQKVASEFVDFDQALTVASAKFPEKIKRGTLAFRELQDAARKVGAETQFTAKESAEGLALFAAAGIDAKVSMAALNGVVDLATATSVEFADATETALSTMGQFGLKAKDAAMFAGNLDRVSDSLVFTINSAQIQMEDLSETLKFVGPIANTAGAEIEEVNSIIAAMAEAGIKGSLAGTALKNMYLRLLEPTPKIRKELKKLNVEIDKDGDGAIQLTGIIGQLEKSMVGMDKKTKAASLSILFGKRAVSGAAAAMQIGSERIGEFERKMRSAGGTSKSTANDIRKGLGNQLKILESTAIELGFKLFEAFVGKGEKGIQRLTREIRKFDVAPIVSGMKEAFRFISKVVEIAWENRGLIVAFAKIVALIEAAKIAMILFNSATSVNPVLAIITGLLMAISLIDEFNRKEKEAANARKMATFGPVIVKEAAAAHALNKEIAAAGPDLEKQLQLHKDLFKRINGISAMKQMAGQANDVEKEALEEIKIKMQEIVDLQGRMVNFGGGSGDLFPGELPQFGPVDFEGGGGFEAPNAPSQAEINAKGFLSSSSLDVNFANAPAGTTTKTKQGRGAPTVNSNLAGANP